jgi:hypothetical protein
MFTIGTSRDFLWKLEADFDDFMKEPYSTRLAVNCALTAYHLHEWVWGDWLKTDYATWKTLRIRDKESFLTWIDKACPWFSTGTGPHRWQTAGALIDAVVRFWREFFFRYHPDPDVRLEVREYQLIA